MFVREALFADRSEAGRALAQRLLPFKDDDRGARAAARRRPRWL
jgi:hypothetical protein